MKYPDKGKLKSRRIYKAHNSRSQPITVRKSRQPMVSCIAKSRRGMSTALTFPTLTQSRTQTLGLQLSTVDLVFPHQLIKTLPYRNVQANSPFKKSLVPPLRFSSQRILDSVKSTTKISSHTVHPQTGYKIATFQNYSKN